MSQIFLTLAAIFGSSSVAAGAFASHALKGKVSEHYLQIFEVGARYQMYHALALFLVALLIISTQPQTSLVVSGWLFVIGILIFSGSLYALSLTEIKILGAITPIGGVAFIIGWLSLALAAWNLKS